MSYKIPHNSVFIQAGTGRFENVSFNGITTEIIFSAPFYNKEKAEVNVEKKAKMENTIVGQLNESIPNGEEIFVHKKDISRAFIQYFMKTKLLIFLFLSTNAFSQIGFMSYKKLSYDKFIEINPKVEFKTSTKDYNLNTNKPVKSLKLKYANGVKTVLAEQVEFDKNGNIISIIDPTTNIDAETDEKLNFKYQYFDNLIVRKTFGQHIEIDSVFLNDSKQIIKHSITKHKKSDNTKIYPCNSFFYEYDSENRIKKKKMYQYYNSQLTILENVTKYSYENNKIVKEYYQNENYTLNPENDEGKLKLNNFRKVTFLLNSDNLIYSRYTGGGVKEFKYNIKNQLIEVTENTTYYSKIVFEYDFKENIIKTTCYVDNEIDLEFEDNFDAYNNSIQRTTYSKNNQVLEKPLVEYRPIEYDKYGNVIKITQPNGREKVLYEIIYY